MHQKRGHDPIRKTWRPQVVWAWITWLNAVRPSSSLERHQDRNYILARFERSECFPDHGSSCPRWICFHSAARCWRCRQKVAGFYCAVTGIDLAIDLAKQGQGDSVPAGVPVENDPWLIWARTRNDAGNLAIISVRAFVDQATVAKNHDRAGLQGDLLRLHRSLRRNQHC